MADAVTTQVIQDGARYAIVKLTNVSDGTGEAAVSKVTPSSLAANPINGAACSRVHIDRIWYSTAGMSVQLFWDATTDVFILGLAQDMTGELDLSDTPGITNNAGTGITGIIQLTTVGHTSGDTYAVILKLKKVY